MMYNLEEIEIEAINQAYSQRIQTLFNVMIDEIVAGANKNEVLDRLRKGMDILRQFRQEMIDLTAEAEE